MTKYPNPNVNPKASEATVNVKLLDHSDGKRNIQLMSPIDTSRRTKGFSVGQYIIGRVGGTDMARKGTSLNALPVLQRLLI